jgi:hypothetical protein
MTEHTPSQAALKAAVELEIEGCIGAITTQGLALKIDAVAQAVAGDHQNTLVSALEDCIEEMEYFEGDFGGSFDVSLEAARAALSLSGADRGGVS